MRARGAKVTDIAVLVVAADDGVKPQTIEALNHAQAADVPIVVAVNKIDKGADPQKVRGQLTEYGLVAEEFGGDTMFVDVSAKAEIGIRSFWKPSCSPPMRRTWTGPTPSRTPRVWPSRRTWTRVAARWPRSWCSAGRSSMASIVIGEAHGRVRAMLDENGNPVDEALPSRPVQVLGLTAVPDAGDTFLVVSEDRIARQIANTRQARERNAELAARRGRRTLEDILRGLEKGETGTLNLIIKGDVSGSVEALEDAVAEAGCRRRGRPASHPPRVGAITQNDVNLATVDSAIIIGFNVRTAERVAELAERRCGHPLPLDHLRGHRRGRASAQRACSSRSTRKPPWDRGDPRGLPLEQGRQHRRCPGAVGNHPPQLKARVIPTVSLWLTT